MRRLVEFSDITCIGNLRMSRNAFGKLYRILQTQEGLEDSKHVPLSSQVAMFLSILAHHKKNCIVKYDFIRSGRTVSKHFHRILNAVLRLHPLLLANPTPVPPNNSCPSWKWFEGCLGALDGMYIDVRVKAEDMARYRTRKGSIVVNVLGVCDRDMRFIYVLVGWEGSAADNRVLRDAITRPTGLKIPRGNYYLVDSGYSNSEGFLSSYRGVRYHLKEWESGNNMPQNHQDFFNMKHASARNVIERTFGLLKARWAILRSPSFYDIDDQNRIIIACCLLHNFIRQEMSVDPLETMLLMDDDGSKEVRRRGVKQDGKLSSRVWSTSEEEALLEYLREIWFWLELATNTIDVKDDVFDNFAKTLRYKSLPYYAQWCEVFGKDRAMGERGFDPIFAPRNPANTAETERSENVPVTPEYYVPTPDPSLYGDDEEFMNSFASATAKRM
ncbi:UNVERIFIED_CONTAM: hypothetical protein Slati_2785000 [Sesamum latifolium]|uniref:Transposase n=1 Tax=Sesamum latifolium TaxID=2727402 RepID=A0AAW2W2I1_9LAMI